MITKNVLIILSFTTISVLNIYISLDWHVPVNFNFTFSATSDGSCSNLSLMLHCLQNIIWYYSCWYILVIREDTLPSNNQDLRQYFLKYFCCTLYYYCFVHFYTNTKFEENIAEEELAATFLRLVPFSVYSPTSIPIYRVVRKSYLPQIETYWKQ